MSNRLNECFFVVGCQRSGTTLLRLILECHTLVSCYDEFSSYRILAGRQCIHSPSPVTGLKVPCITEQLADLFLCDKWFLPSMPNVYSGQKVLFVIRDVRDTISSMITLKVDTKSWLERFGIPCLRWKLKNPAFRSRYGGLVDDLPEGSNHNVGFAAIYWKYKVDAFFDYLANAFPVLLVRYEDLVSQPQVELMRICGFLQIPWEKTLLGHTEFYHDEIMSNGLAIGNTDPNRRIDRQSIGRWRALLTGEQEMEIMNIAGTSHSAFYPF